MNAFIRSWVAPSIALLALSVAGCEDKPTAVVQDAGAIDSGPPKPILGGKLGAAVAAAESANAAPRSSAGGTNGPPEAGFFAPGAADVAHPPNTPAKVEVLGEGSDPKIALTLSPKDEQKGLLSVSVRLGPQALPTIDFGLSFKIDKPKDKGEKGKDEKSKSDSNKAEPVPLIVTVTSAAPGKEQPGQLPKELAAVIGKLKGSEIRCQLTPTGAIVNPTVTLNKDADQGLNASLQALSETLTLMTVPLPQKPLGVGGYWIVTDRNASLGGEVIRYRVFKVEKIEQGHAKLSIDTRQYAAKGEIELGTLSGGANGALPLDRYESQGKGSIEWDAGAIVPRGQILQRLMAQIGGAKGGAAKLLQIEMTAKSSEPESSEKTK